jgi:Lipocalin-like domain
MPRTTGVLALTLLAGAAQAQTPADLVGAWRLVSMVRVDSAGRSTPFWDDRPTGLIVYTADGHMAAQLYDSRRPRLGVRWESAGPEAARAAYAGLLTYFGTYSVDRAAATVTHTVEGAMAPDWVGSKLVRAYRFVTPDRLELRVVTDATGRSVTNGSTLVWERAARRAP